MSENKMLLNVDDSVESLRDGWEIMDIPWDTILGFGADEERVISQIRSGDLSKNGEGILLQERAAEASEIRSSSPQCKDRMAAEMKRAIGIYSRGGSYDYEVRGFTKRGPVAGRFDDRGVSQEALFRQVLDAEYKYPIKNVEDGVKYGHKGASKNKAWYITPNPIKTAESKLAYNTIDKAAAGGTTGDTQIAKRQWLLLDFDPIRPVSDSSSSLLEKNHARLKAIECLKLLKAEGWPEPVVADSGNGYHILVPVDQPNTDEMTALHKAVLASFHSILNSPEVSFDTSVYNAARIFKLYGTFARKGGWEVDRTDPMLTRPWRFSHVISIPKEYRILTTDQMIDFTKKYPVAEQTVQPYQESTVPTKNSLQTQSVNAGSHTHDGEFDGEGYFTAALAAVGADFNQMTQTVISFAQRGWKGECPFCAQQGKTGKRLYVYQHKSGGWGVSCHGSTCVLHKGASENRWAKFQELTGVPAGKGYAYDGDDVITDGAYVWTKSPTSLDLSERWLNERCCSGLLYSRDTIWRCGEDSIWRQVSEQDIKHEIKAWNYEPIIKKGKVKGKVCLEYKDLNNAYKCVKDEVIRRTHAEYGPKTDVFADRPYGFLCSDGVFYEVNVESAKIKPRPVTPKDRCRFNLKVTSTEAEKAKTLDGTVEKNSLFMKYLEGLTATDNQANKHAKFSLVGEIIFAALTGIGHLPQKAILCHGIEGSGKSQFLKLLEGVFSGGKDYVTHLTPQNYSATFDSAELANSSLNICYETPDWSFQDDSNLKAVITGDTVHVQRKHGHPFSFSPRLLSVFAANDLPRATKVSQAFYDRFLVMPFVGKVRGTDAEIPEITKKILSQELDRVIAVALITGQTMLDRCKDKKLTYSSPESTLVAINEWRQESDVVGQWVSARCEPTQEKAVYKWTKVTDLYKKYQEESREYGEAPLSLKNFKKRLGLIGVKMGVANKQDYVNLKPLDFSALERQQRLSQDTQVNENNKKIENDLIGILERTYN
jgi:hypothetical protein